jgi:CubicO group peptidase (beta-lactamase class C family)
MKLRMAVLSFGVSVLLYGCSHRDRDERPAKVDDLFAPWSARRSPGCSVGVLRSGEFLLRRGYGSADLEHRTPIGPDTVFDLASMSKQFTAASIGLLITQGKLSLEDDVRKYVPELPDYGDRILVRDLVYHTSGIRDYISLTEDLTDFHTAATPTRRDYLDLLVRQRGLNYPPGTQFSYNNSNYFLLGIIVERVTGLSLREFADKNIFEPLGMRHTHFEDDPSEVVERQAIGYEPTGTGFWGPRFSPVTVSFAEVGDGGLFTTLDDLALWDQEYYAERLGGAKLHDLLLTTGRLRDGTTLNYAFGLYVASSWRGVEVYHGGNDFGFRTRIMRYPEYQTSVICLCNLSTISTDPLARSIGNIYLGEPPPIAVRQGLVSPETLRQMEGSYRDPSTSGIWVFKVRDGQLVGNLLGIPGERVLLATGPLTFSTSNELFKAVFSPSSGSVEIAENNAPPRVFSRVELAQPKNLIDYVGRYYNDELDATYEFAVKGGVLTVLTPKVAAASLAPTIADCFTGYGNYFLFQRSADNSIIGFRLSENTGRVRNVYFRKSSQNRVGQDRSIQHSCRGYGKRASRRMRAANGCSARPPRLRPASPDWLLGRWHRLKPKHSS